MERPKGEELHINVPKGREHLIDSLHPIVKNNPGTCSLYITVCGKTYKCVFCTTADIRGEVERILGSGTVYLQKNGANSAL
jgi:hypothetical protein